MSNHDEGLQADLLVMGRRQLLGLASGLGVAGLLAACGANGSPEPTASSAPSASAPSPSATSPSASATSLTVVPDETAGPYPGDGSNGPNVLDDTGIVRSDIRSSFGSSTTTAAGVPLTIRLTVRTAATGDALTGAAVYVWHCDQDGAYSLYGQGTQNENYLRGVQQVDAGGTASFTSIFPGCYPGRWPHIHFEVYSALGDAVASGPIVRTSQIALPREVCEAVYTTPGYETSSRNLSGVTLSSDRVFGDDGGIHQIATVTGDATSGYAAALTIGV